ncbi:MAG: cobalamin-dependent protein [Moraxellaceae bacterium]|nr:cobalamin-dependent protein [Moraxellaceae bacterium]
MTTYHKPELYQPKNKVRFVTAASLFDGHDAAINIMRRMLQATGCEVIHLGHNRSVDEIVTCALQEDAHGIAISSYQGGHNEFFAYMIDLLNERGLGHVKVFGGGGGVIVPSEIKALQAYGVARIFSPEDGAKIGLQGMINQCAEGADQDLAHQYPADFSDLASDDVIVRHRTLARIISALEAGVLPYKDELLRASIPKTTPVIGITGTGGAGKSSLTDEVLRRFRLDFNDQVNIAIISIDPSRRKSGGALLGDRIRMNAIHHPNIYMRSLATRSTGGEISQALPDVIAACKVAGFDLIIVETSGIGQGDAAIVPFVDLSLYVMTPEFGAASQLEKIDMLDFADIVAINKFDRKGAKDAQRDVCKQVQRNREAFMQMPDTMPVFGTIAARFNDDGVTALYQQLKTDLIAKGWQAPSIGQLPVVTVRASSQQHTIVPAQRVRYLAEIADGVRGYHAWVEAQAQLARQRQQLQAVQQMLATLTPSPDKGEAGSGLLVNTQNPTLTLPLQGEGISAISQLMTEKDAQLTLESKQLLSRWPELKQRYAQDELVVKIRDKELRTQLTYTSLSGSKIPKVSLPKFHDDGDILAWQLRENIAGEFPFTAGVFPFKREGEDPTRMFAGEGDAFRTNARFKRVSEGMPAKRLSTAFDSVTLYGNDPHERPDIYGKVGNSGVSIATLEDMKVLYSGFDLTNPMTSVSMTINGPAPTILAMFLNTAIQQNVDKYVDKNQKQPSESELAQITTWTLENVRGTVQADILKEDQGQNTCIFSTEFSLKVMGDIQQYFVENRVRNFYSVSISGYHIAEAGANPISQLAFTLANGFTFVEAYLARGMSIDDFAPNLSFFFSNGMDPEYTVLGRVARRIWAITMRQKYGANERSQKLKYHIQTSGRSLHAQEIDFNDIRTTLQALIAIYDNCNSLHTNAFDEAITTPTEDSVRRAMAIQLIINREWGLAKNENPNQGSFIIDELTDLVEEAVLKEFEAISERGGVLGAMETGYQRGKIQEESMYYEHLKHSGEYPIIGVNTFRNPKGETVMETLELARSTDEEKQSQLQRLRGFQHQHADHAATALARLQEVCINNGNIFAELMTTVRYCSLGQITEALFSVGGQYRRNM